MTDKEKIFKKTSDKQRVTSIRVFMLIKKKKKRVSRVKYHPVLLIVMVNVYQMY